MKSIYKGMWALSLLVMADIGFTPIANAQFVSPNNIVVHQIGPGAGNTAPSAQSNPIALIELTPTGTVASTINIPQGSNGGIVGSGTQTQEGHLVVSEDNKFIGLAGYQADFYTVPGSGSHVVNSPSTAPRAVGRVGQNGNFNLLGTTPTSGGAFGNSSIRSGLFADGKAYAVGASGGVVRMDGTPVRVTAGNPVNNRFIGTFFGRIYISTGSTPLGIYVVGDGTAQTDYTVSNNAYDITTPFPTTSLQGDLELVVPLSGSPVSFFFTNQTTCYVADEGTGANGGVSKMVWNAGSWTRAARWNSTSVGARSVYVDNADPSNPIIYFVSLNNTVVKVTDVNNASTGDITLTAANTIYTAPANRGLRGITRSPLPDAEPASKFAVTSINSGSAVTVSRPFSLSIQTQTASNNPQAVTNATEASISTSVGTLTGTTTTTFTSASATNVVSGIVASQSGMQTFTVARTSGETLTDGIVNVNVLPTASQLTFSTINSNLVLENALNFTVSARRADNSIETTYPGNATISLASGTGNLIGTLTKPFVNGVATFEDIFFSTAGVKTITVNAAGTPALNNTTANLTVASGVTTYTWIAGGGALFNNASSWSPTRTTPQTSDRLVIGNGFGVIDIDMTGTPTQTVAGLDINASVIFRTTNATPVTLNVGAGQMGSDFVVRAGARLTLQNAVAGGNINIGITANNTGEVFGAIVYRSAGTGIVASHTLNPVTTGSLVFKSGSILTQELTCDNSNIGAFGNSGNAGAAVFEDGATFFHQAGNQPFQTPNRVTFQPNAIFRLGVVNPGNIEPVFSISGRSYPILEINYNYRRTVGFAQAFTCNVLRVNQNLTFGFFTTSTNDVSAVRTFNTLELRSGAEYVERPSGTGAISGNLVIGSISSQGNCRIELASPVTQSLVFNNGSNSVKTLIYRRAGASIGINAPLIVNDTIATVGTAAINSNSNVILNSSQFNSAVVPAGSNVNGTVTARRFVGTIYQQSGLGARWASSPFTNATAGDLAPNNDLSNNAVQQWNEASDASQVGSGWAAISNPSQVLTPGRGYVVIAAANNFFDISGTLNTGDVAASVTRTANGSGFNFVGNPYTQAIDWNAVVADASFEASGLFNAHWKWFPVSPTQGGYISYINGFPSSQRFIAPMQGFLVQVRPSAGNGNYTLNFKNSFRAGTSIPFGRIASDLRPALELNLTAPNNISDIAAVYFDNNATMGFDDDFDARKMGNNTGMPTLSFLAGTTRLGVKGMPTPTEATIIPMDVRANVAGLHNFNIANIQNMENFTMYLIDDVENTSTLITPTFNHSVRLIAGANNGRFRIQFVPSAVTSVGANLAKAAFNAYPNPSTDGKFNLVFTNISKGEKATITITDVAGKTIFSQAIDLNEGSTTYQLPSNLVKGMFIINARTASNQFVQKVIVE